MADYWLVRKRSLDVRHLYVLRGGKFWFWHGINWRAYAAFLCAYIPNIPGFVSEVSPSIKNVQPYTYDLNWIFAVIVSVLTFWALNLIFPPTYSLSGEAVHPDEVVDWSTRTRVGDWSGVPGFEDEEIQGEEVLNYTKGTEGLGGNMHNVMDGPQKADSEASLEKTV
jgi:NCS1 family nucleobase:cation symporter-1